MAPSTAVFFAILFYCVPSLWYFYAYYYVPYSDTTGGFAVIMRIRAAGGFFPPSSLPMERQRRHIFSVATPGREWRTASAARHFCSVTYLRAPGACAAAMPLHRTLRTSSGCPRGEELLSDEVRTRNERQRGQGRLERQRKDELVGYADHAPACGASLSC